MSITASWITDAVAEHYRKLGLDVPGDVATILEDENAPLPAATMPASPGDAQLQARIEQLEARIQSLEQQLTPAPVFDIGDLGEPLDADDPDALAEYCGDELDDGYGEAFAGYVEIDYRAEIEQHLGRGPLTAAMLENKISADYPGADENELADGVESTLVDMGESGDLFDSYPNGGGPVMLADVPADIRDLRNLRHLGNPPRKAELLWREMVKRKLRADRGHGADVPGSWERDHGLAIAAGV